MKKVIFVMLIVCLLAACSPSSKKGPIEVSAAEVLEKLSDERQNSFLLYVISDDCYSCDEYQKVIEEIEKQQPFEVYYLHINLKEKDADVKKMLDELKDTTGVLRQLPTTYYFYQGTLQAENRKEGYLEKKDLIAWLKNLHILH